MSVSIHVNFLLFLSLFQPNHCEVFCFSNCKCFLLLLEEATGPWIPAGEALDVLECCVVFFQFPLIIFPIVY